MSAATVSVQHATIRQYAKRLQLATIAGQFVPMAEQAIKEKQGHLNYLEVLLGMEVEERERNTVARRIKEAHFPKVKTLEEFAFCAHALVHRLDEPTGISLDMVASPQCPLPFRP